MGDVLLICRRVSYTFPKAQAPVLRGLSLAISAGEFLAVMGKNGSGKSTLARLCCGLIQPTEGTVRASAVGYVAQDPAANIVGERVDEDVAFGPIQAGLSRSQVEKRVNQALAAVEMEWAAKRAMNSLSGGELQRVAIAGALAAGARLLVLDEPTSHLSKQDALAVRRVVADLRRPKANSASIGVLWVTHRPQEVYEADRVIVLGAGSIALEGSPRAVLGRSCLLEMLGVRPDPLVEVASLCDSVHDQGAHAIPWEIERIGEKLCSRSAV